MSSIAIPASSSRRTAAVIAPARSTERHADGAVLDDGPLTGHGRERGDRVLARVAVAQVHLQTVAPHLRFQLVGGSDGNYGTPVDHRDPVGKPIRLVEVLRGQEHGRAAGDERFHHIPEAKPAADIETRRRLVEEEHRRPRNQGGGEVEPAAHAARVGAHEPTARLVEVEIGEELPSSRPRRLPAEVIEAADHLEVLEAGHVLVDGCVLSREADVLAHALRLTDDVEARHARRPLVRPHRASSGSGPQWSCRRRSAPADRRHSRFRRGGRHRASACTSPYRLRRPAVSTATSAIRPRYLLGCSRPKWVRSYRRSPLRTPKGMRLLSSGSFHRTLVPTVPVISGLPT